MTDDNVTEEAKYLLDCVRIEPLALQEEFIRLPADYSYWNEQYRQSLERHLLAKAERERVWAGRYIVESERTHPTTGKPVTVDYAKANIEIDAEYQQTVADSIAAEAAMAHARGVLEAIRTKRECLISLGATQRQELEHDPLVRSRAENERMARGR